MQMDLEEPMEEVIEPPPAAPTVVKEVDADTAKQAEAAKDAGNQAFKAKHFSLAIDEYTKAIELNPYNAIYFSNRAFANMKLENYGAAVADATRALEIDPRYVKGYYRRGDANFAMGKFRLALKDLKTAAKVAPKDPDLKRKLAECEKEVKRLKFEEALATPEEVMMLVTPTLDLKSMQVEDSYKGPHMEGNDEEGYRMTLDFAKAALQEFKEQRLIHRRYAFEIIVQAQELFKAQPSLVDVSIPEEGHFTVCGDVHGQFYDLLNIFELNGLPSETNPYLFNGDFVDRGSFSVEVILSLLMFKVLYPEHMHLARGNHESKNMNKIYGFDGEVKHKYNALMIDVFRETFCWLPLAHLLNGRVLVLHGGLFSSDDVTLDDLRHINRFREPPDEGLMCELLWSDPGPMPGRNPSKRGIGVTFGPDVTKRFLEKNGLELVVRSHEVKEEGYELEHDGLLVTIFSAPNYCDQLGNKGAFIRFNGNDMVPHFTKFDAVPHPAVRPMAYASSVMQWGM